MICKVIAQVQEEFGRECLGEDLYKWLIDDIATIPANVQEWSAANSYDIDAYVMRGNCMFVSILDCNRNDPNSDTDGNWETAKRFETECANELWEGYMRQILACKTVIQTLNFATYPVRAGGVTALDAGTIYNTQGFKSASKGELNDVKLSMFSIVDTLTKNMLYWSKKKIDNGLCADMPLNDMLRCNGMCRTESVQARRRFAL